MKYSPGKMEKWKQLSRPKEMKYRLDKTETFVPAKRAEIQLG
jgi:hypothetical protein